MFLHDLQNRAADHASGSDNGNVKRGLILGHEFVG